MVVQFNGSQTPGGADFLRSVVVGLTPRESEVMHSVAMGRTAKQIARSLHISHRTVEGHRARVFLKTGARNAVELARMSLRAEEHRD